MLTCWKSVSLNPCFSGGWSQSYVIVWKGRKYAVLILVLVEDGLRVIRVCISMRACAVLILVLVEDGLRVTAK